MLRLSDLIPRALLHLVRIARDRLADPFAFFERYKSCVHVRPVGRGSTGLPVNHDGKADFDILSDIHGQCFAHGWNADDLARLANGKEILFLLAEWRRTHAHPPQPAGFAVARIGGDEAEILTLAVARAARRHGAARKLMETALDHLYNLGIKSLFLEVGMTNHAALALYHSLGFEQVGLRRNYFRHAAQGSDDAMQSSDAAIMRRNLTHMSGRIH